MRRKWIYLGVLAFSILFLINARPVSKMVVVRGVTAQNLSALMEWVYQAQKKVGTLDYTVSSHFRPGIQSHEIEGAYFLLTMGRDIDCGYEERGPICTISYSTDEFAGHSNEELIFNGSAAESLCRLELRRQEFEHRTRERPPKSADVIQCDPQGRAALLRYRIGDF